MKIKICGLTRPKEANYINEARVDYAGFVFYGPSKRNVSIAQAREIKALLNPQVKCVAVMVAPDIELINQVQEAGFDILQIHKALTEEMLDAARLPIWYAINILDESEAKKKLSFIENLSEDREKKIEAILVDAPEFGSGKTFNWHKSRRLLKAGAQSPPERKLFVLAGGLDASNVAEGIRLFEPDIVDVSSSVEGDDGKDKDKILSFAEAVRNL